MKKLIIFLSLALLSISACAMGFGRIYYSPGIYFNNLTSKEILNAKCNWAGNWLVGPGNVGIGNSASQSFQINNIKQIYGPVHITWENEAGQKFEKTFEFTENDLPVSDFELRKEFDKLPLNQKNYSDPRSFFYVKIEFKQNGVEYYTSHTPGASERGKNSGKIMRQLRKANR